MKKLFAVAIGLLALGLAALPVRAQALAERVPDNALVYMGWQGTEKLKPQYEASHLKAVMDASTMRKFFGESLPKILDRAQAAGAGGPVAIAKDLLEVGEVMCKYPTALYVGPVVLPAGSPPTTRRAPQPGGEMEGGGGPAGGPPQVHVALVCVAGAEAEAVEKQIKGILEKVGEPNGPFPVDVKRDGTTVVVTLGTLPAETMGMLMGHGGAKNLGANKEFVAAVGQVQKDAGADVLCERAGDPQERGPGGGDVQSAAAAAVGEDQGGVESGGDHERGVVGGF